MDDSEFRMCTKLKGNASWFLAFNKVYSYYKLVKNTEDDPEFDTKKAKKKLRPYVEVTTTRSG